MKATMTRLAATAALLLSPLAHAGLITFDELRAGGDLVSLEEQGSHGGFTWSQWYLGDTGVEGYGNGAHSGTNYVMNGYGADGLEIGSDAAFDFAGAWFAAPDINGARAGWVQVDAYGLAGELVGSTGQVAIDGVHRWVAAGFAGVHRLVVTRDEGFFVMDDFTFRQASPVPEPGTLALFAIGAAAIALRRHGKAPR
jgi:PEP-CTERM motif